MAEMEVTPVSQEWLDVIPEACGGRGHWLPKGELPRPTRWATYWVRFADVDTHGDYDLFLYTGSVYPDVDHDTGELSYDDESCYHVEAYIDCKDRDVRWWSAPIPRWTVPQLEEHGGGMLNPYIRRGKLDEYEGVK